MNTLKTTKEQEKDKKRGKGKEPKYPTNLQENYTKKPERSKKNKTKTREKRAAKATEKRPFAGKSQPAAATKPSPKNENLLDPLSGLFSLIERDRSMSGAENQRLNCGKPSIGIFAGFWMGVGHRPAPTKNANLPSTGARRGFGRGAFAPSQLPDRTALIFQLFG